jgi:hypothetical protein
MEVVLPNAISGICRFTSFTQRNNEYPMRILLLGEYHTNGGKCEESVPSISVTDFIKYTVETTPPDQCLDLFFESSLHVLEKLRTSTEMEFVPSSREVSPLFDLFIPNIFLPFKDKQNIRFHDFDDIRYFSHTLVNQASLYKSFGLRSVLIIQEILYYIVECFIRRESIPREKITQLVQIHNDHARRWPKTGEKRNYFSEEFWSNYFYFQFQKLYKELSKCYLDEAVMLGVLSQYLVQERIRNRNKLLNSHHMFLDVFSGYDICITDMYCFFRIFKRVEAPERKYYVQSENSNPWIKEKYRNSSKFGTREDAERYLTENRFTQNERTSNIYRKGEESAKVSTSSEKCASERMKNIIVYTGAGHSDSIGIMLQILFTSLALDYRLVDKGMCAGNPEVLPETTPGLMCLQEVNNYSFWDHDEDASILGGKKKTRRRTKRNRKKRGKRDYFNFFSYRRRNF